MNELYRAFEKVPFIFLSTYYAHTLLLGLFKKKIFSSFQ